LTAVSDDANRRRIDVILDPEYVDGLSELSLDDVRARRDEALEVETEISYVRRLAQARIDILEAERDRRAAGGSVGDLVASLHKILSDPAPRSNPTSARLPRLLAPSMAIEWKRGLEYLIADSTLVNLPTISADDLTSTIELLHELEHDVSARRRELHEVLQQLESDIVTRHRDSA
jgi:hypothetical protein